MWLFDFFTPDSVQETITTICLICSLFKQIAIGQSENNSYWLIEEARIACCRQLLRCRLLYWHKLETSIAQFSLVISSARDFGHPTSLIELGRY